MQGSPPQAWRKSSYSGDGNNCVELASLPAGVGVRDSQDPDAGSLLLPPSVWRSLAGHVKAGRLNLPL